jgi:hypothetical protein
MSEDDPQKQGLKPGTVEGELDSEDNLIAPVRQALRDADAWKRQNADASKPQGNGKR